MDSYAITLPCSNGFTLHIDGENLVVATKKQNEIIPISKIQSFSIKEPGFAHGSITFKTSQSATAGVNLGLGLGLALGAERTFFYAKSDVNTAYRLRDYIADHEKRKSSPASLPEGKVVSVVDEIRGLKGLLDDGILTQEEFEAKKKLLLGI